MQPTCACASAANLALTSCCSLALVSLASRSLRAPAPRLQARALRWYPSDPPDTAAACRNEDIHWSRLLE